MKNKRGMIKCPWHDCTHEAKDTDAFSSHFKKHLEPDISMSMSLSLSQSGSGPRPTNVQLYNYVKGLASKKFKSKSGVYRSSWIVKEYKKRGGKYSGEKSSKSGLKRWYKERWVDLNRPIKDSRGKIVGYRSCGRTKVKNSNDKYPLCRPSKRVSKKTPRTYKSLSRESIRKAKREKSRIKHRGNIRFSRRK